MTQPVESAGMALGYLIMFLGLVGAVLPIVPGPPIIWLGALVWAWADGFQRIDWPVLIVLGLLAVVGVASDWLLAPLTTRGAGFGWKTVLAAFVGGVLGGIFLSEIPIIGTLFGAVLGSLLAVMLVTGVAARSHQAAFRAGGHYLLGCAISTFVEFSLSLIMLGLFAWQVMV